MCFDCDVRAQAGLPDRSDRYNERVARNEGRITGFVREARGAHVVGFTRSKKRLVEKVFWGFFSLKTLPSRPPPALCNH